MGRIVNYKSLSSEAKRKVRLAKAETGRTVSPTGEISKKGSTSKKQIKVTTVTKTPGVREAIVEHVKQREASPVEVSQKLHQKYEGQRRQEAISSHKEYVKAGIRKQKEEEKDIKIRTATKTPGVREAIVEHVKQREAQPVKVSEKFHEKTKFTIASHNIQQKLKSEVKKQTFILGSTAEKIATDVGSVGATGIITMATVGAGTVLLSGVAKSYPVVAKVIAGGLTASFGYTTYKSYKKAETEWDKLIVVAKTHSAIVGGVIGYDIGKFLIQPTITADVKGLKSHVISKPGIKTKTAITKGKVTVKTSTKIRDMLHLKPKKVQTFKIESKGYLLKAGNKLVYHDPTTGKYIALKEGEILGAHKGSFVGKKGKEVPFKLVEKGTIRDTHVSSKGIAQIKKQTFTTRSKTYPITQKRTLTHYGIKKGTWTKGKGLAIGKGVTQQGKTKIAPEGIWIQQDFKTLSSAKGTKEIKALIKVAGYHMNIKNLPSAPPLATGHIETIAHIPVTKSELGPSPHIISGLATSLAKVNKPESSLFLIPFGGVKTQREVIAELGKKEDIKVISAKEEEKIQEQSGGLNLQTKEETTEDVIEDVRSRSGSSQATAQIQTPIQEIQTQQIQTPIQTTPSPTPPVTTPPLIFGYESQEELEYDKGGDVGLFVRRQGVFRKMGEFQTEEEALFRGKKIVSQTAGASFKIDDLSIDPFRTGILSRVQFRESTKEPGVFIEKKEKRIKSHGELQEITFKGIEAIKRKSKKSKGILSIFGG